MREPSCAWRDVYLGPTNGKGLRSFERAVVRTGPIFASILRAVCVKRLHCRNRGERALLHHAHERVAALLGMQECVTGAPERPRSRPADAGATRASPEKFWR
jgi:hypothetical protein